MLLFIQRLADGGPVYAETDLSRVVAEPWNAASAVLFIGIALYWLWKLRGRYEKYPFVAIAQPVLLLGGIGGSLYHGLRSSPLYLYLDIGPIFALSFAAGLYLWYFVWKRWWYFIAAIPLFLVGRYTAELYFSAHLVINVSYALLAVFLLAPIALVLRETNGRHRRWVFAALISFALALFFRLIDLQAPLPMGTHWLWHALGAVSSGALITYLYRIRPLLDPERPYPVQRAAMQ